MVDIDHDRGTGRTTKQMLGAPLRAVFIWCNAALDYPKGLAEKHGRSDLEIVSPQWITDHRYRGREVSGIVVDHAAQWKHVRYSEYLDAFARVRQRA